MQKLDDFKVTSSKFDLSKMPAKADCSKADKAKYVEETARLAIEIQELQEALYADGREGLIIVLQALDAAGKDSLIKHVMGAFDPQGVDVRSFKQPSSSDLAHGFLWRAEAAVPERGKIGIFNRSYYEDVLVVKVHDIRKTYKMPPRCLDVTDEKFFERRYREICHYEEYLYNNGYRILKLFLNVSKKEQGKRFLERMNNPDKTWKVSSSDMHERGFWDNYQKAFEEAICATATKEAPWYVLPADHKWQTRYFGALAIKDTLERCCTQYPKLTREKQASIDEAREQLMEEMQK